MKKHQFLAMAMAGVTAFTSVGIVAYADNENSEALAAAITTVKNRIDIPEDLTEFSYSVSKQNLKTVYYLTWSTPSNVSMYNELSVQVCDSMILNYQAPEDRSTDYTDHLAELTNDQLYKKAKAQLKKLNPTLSKVLKIDRDSIYVSLYGSSARFTFYRTKNGVPVQNDSGTIVLNKDTGEIISLSLDWHPGATFQSAKTVISEDEAKEAYKNMIGLTPHYEFDYDYTTQTTTARLVYSQSDYGRINAFTGKKSDFAADGYFGEDFEDEDSETASEASADTGNPGAGGYTEQEKAEINKDLPYASKDAVVELLKSNEWFSYNDKMELGYSSLYTEKLNGKKTYYYDAYFTDENWSEEEEEVYEVEDYTASSEENIEPYHSIAITVNAETGEVQSYSYYDSSSSNYADSYDLSKADSAAREVAKTLAGDKYGSYTDYSSSVSSITRSYADSTELYTGSSHTWNRYENGFMVSGNTISVRFNSDMTLKRYSISYTDVALPSPDSMLTADQVMDKFWERNTLDLYYLARVNEKKVKTVLVYGTDNSVYVDAFTGEDIYTWMYDTENDLSGITDKTLLKMAQRLDDHGIAICDHKFSEDDYVTNADLENALGTSSTSGELTDNITRSAALIAFTRLVSSDKVAKLKGIYKSPFSDISDDNPCVGYYAIAYAWGVFTEDKLDATRYFTYGDLIRMVYAYYTAK